MAPYTVNSAATSEHNGTLKVLRRFKKLQVVPQARVHVGGHARLTEYPARACVAGPLCGLEADCGELADLR